MKSNVERFCRLCHICWCRSTFWKKNSSEYPKKGHIPSANSFTFLFIIVLSANCHVFYNHQEKNGWKTKPFNHSWTISHNNNMTLMYPLRQLQCILIYFHASGWNYSIINYTRKLYVASFIGVNFMQIIPCFKYMITDKYNLIF